MYVVRTRYLTYTHNYDFLLFYFVVNTIPLHILGKVYTDMR